MRYVQITNLTVDNKMSYHVPENNSIIFQVQNHLTKKFWTFFDFVSLQKKIEKSCKNKHLFAFKFMRDVIKYAVFDYSTLNIWTPRIFSSLRQTWPHNETPGSKGKR